MLKGIVMSWLPLRDGIYFQDAQFGEMKTDVPRIHGDLKPNNINEVVDIGRLLKNCCLQVDSRQWASGPRDWSYLRAIMTSRKQLA